MGSFSAVGMVLYDVLSHLEKDEDRKARKTFAKALGANEHLLTQDQRMLLEEWLLFEWRSATGESLLARALACGCLTLEQTQRCKDLETNVYSYWQVSDVVQNYGFTLTDRYDGASYRVVAPELSDSLDDDAFFVTRICKIGSKWRPCSGSISLRSLIFSEALEKSLFAQRPHDFGILYVHKNKKNGHNTTPNKAVLSYDQAVEQFEKTLQHTGLDTYFTAKHVENWFRKADSNKEPMPLSAPLTIIFGLAYGAPYDHINELLASFQEFQMAWRERYPVTASPASGTKGVANHMFELDPEEWRQPFDEAVNLTHSGDHVAAYAQYRKAFSKLLQAKGVFNDVYRLLYNAAISAMSQDPTSARKLAGLALELNPQYDLALDFVERYDSGQLDESLRTMQLLTVLQEIETLLPSPKGAQPSREQLNELKKKQRAFQRRMQTNSTPHIVTKEYTDYVRWLQTFNINFTDASKTTDISTYDILGKRPSSKLGRNSPCYCGSGKKFKHCHG